MRRNKFFGKFNLTEGLLRITDPEIANQIRKVLKLHPGEEIILNNNDGLDAVALIKSFGENSLEVEVLSISPNNNDPQTQVVLYCSILKNENFELVVQKATEAGVKEIVPLICGRTVKQSLRPERLTRIMREAAEQSNRARVPLLNEIMLFDDAIKHSRENGLNLFLDISGSDLKEAPGVKRVGLFIGPEGGWSENEIVKVKDLMQVVRLGSLNYRAETAAVIGVYLTAK